MLEKFNKFLELQDEIHEEAFKVATKYFALMDGKSEQKFGYHFNIEEIGYQEISFELYETWQYGGEEWHHISMPTRYLTNPGLLIDLEKEVEAKRLQHKKDMEQQASQYRLKEEANKKALFLDP